MRRYLTLMSTSFLFCLHCISQKISVAGKVLDENGIEISNASIIEKGTKNGTTSNLDGRFTIAVNTGSILVVSQLGYKTQEIKSSTNLTIVLLSLSTNLTEVTVTALGITKSRKGLGYSSQEVDGRILVNSNAGDILNGLNGQIAGLNMIQSSGSAGAPTFVQIRGQNTLTANVQPLIVIDGIVIDNTTFSSNGDGSDVVQGGQDYQTGGVQNSNRAIDVNPDDIESVTVLKGGAATALYGLRGSNGVIIYATKKGRMALGEKKLYETYNTSLTVSEVNKLPHFQNKYVQGTGGQYVEPGSSIGTSWGPLADTMYWNGDANYKYDKNGFLGGKSSANAKTKFVPYQNVDKFFQKGLAYVNSLSLDGGKEGYKFRSSISNSNDKGITPTNTFARTTASFGGSINENKLIGFEGSATFSNSVYNAVQEGSNPAGAFLPLFRAPISFDLLNGQSNKSDPTAFEFSDGTQRTFKSNFDNPYWSINKNRFSSNVNRVYGYLQLNYKLLSWLIVTAKSGIDYYTDNRHQIYDINSNALFGTKGRLIDEEYTYRHSDNYLNLSGKNQISNRISLNFLIGCNYYAQKKY